MERSIIHLNIADFGVAVERLEDNSLKGRPLILAPPNVRGLVYDMSEEAYREGVRKGMPIKRARRLCRAATLLSPRPERYLLAMDTVIKTARHYTPLVERSSGDGHLFLDVTGTHRLFGPAPDIGWRIRKSIRHDLGFEPIWSVAPSKLVAKVASRLVKPVGEYIVSAGEEQDFLSPLPLSILPGLNRSDLLRLREFNLRSIMQTASLSMQQLSIICGSKSYFLYQAVRGIDPSPILPPANKRDSILFHHHFAGDTNDDQTVRAALSGLVEQAGHNLREQGLGTCRLVVELEYSDTFRLARHAASKTALHDNMNLNRLAITALYRGWRRRIRLRRISLSCHRLVRPARQLSLFSQTNQHQQKQEKLCAALDQIQHKFGANRVKRGIQLIN